MRWSFSMQPIKFTVTSLIPCRNGSNQSATQFGFWTNFSHGYEDGLTCATRGPSWEPYQTISTVYFILGILRTDLWSQGIKRRAYKQERGENCFFAHETQFLLTPSLFASLTFLLFPSPDATITCLMRNLSTDDGDVNENGKQATGLDWQNNNSARDHAFCTFLCRHCTTTTWQFLISRFVEDVSTRQRLSFSIPELRYSPRI